MDLWHNVLNLKRLPLIKSGYDATFGIHKRQNGQLALGNTLLQIDGNGKPLKVDDKEYPLTTGLLALITQKHPRPVHYNGMDYKVYKSLVAQIKFKSYRNRAGTVQPHHVEIEIHAQENGYTWRKDRIRRIR